MPEKIEQELEPKDIDSLIVLLEKWLELICQMQVIQDNLSHIPEELGKLKRYSHGKVDRDRFNARSRAILASLDAQLPKLFDLEDRVNDSIALKEIIEALQQKSKNKEDLSYEISFQKAKLKRTISQFKQSDRNSSSGNLLKQKIAHYWDRHYAKLSLAVGVFTIACYGWFVHLGDEQNVEGNIKTLQAREYTSSVTLQD